MNDKLQALGLSGIGTIPSEESVYDSSPVPGISFASNLLGFVNADGVGQYGLEGYYNSILSGVNGHEFTLTDVNGNAIVLGKQQTVPAKNGDNLELGLDPQIQYGAEVALANGVNSSHSVSGHAHDHGHQDRRDRRLGAVPVVQRQRLHQRRPSPTSAISR